MQGPEQRTVPDSELLNLVVIYMLYNRGLKRGLGFRVVSRHCHSAPIGSANAPFRELPKVVLVV